jgi:small subunit ribosomal protein S21|tara:strand:+ start:576 stop:740 length:165 start_codon:yes stop_codon:yes gene_type:complete
MKVLKKKVMKEGLVKEIRQRQFYEKPSDKRVRKNKEMAAAWKKKQKKLKAQRGF